MGAGDGPGGMLLSAASNAVGFIEHLIFIRRFPQALCYPAQLLAIPPELHTENDIVYLLDVLHFLSAATS